MAERLRNFDFTAQSAVTAATNKGRNRYPWNEWFDGDIWKITQGEDFSTSPLMMERIIRTRASNKNHRAKVRLRHLPSTNGDSPSIVLQRTDVTGPSTAKKEATRQKRAAKKATAEVQATQTLQAAGLAPKVNGKTAAKKPAKTASKRPSKRLAGATA